MKSKDFSDFVLYYYRKTIPEGMSSPFGFGEMQYWLRKHFESTAFKFDCCAYKISDDYHLEITEKQFRNNLEIQRLGMDLSFRKKGDKHFKIRKAFQLCIVFQIIDKETGMFDYLEGVRLALIGYIFRTYRYFIMDNDEWVENVK